MFVAEVVVAVEAGLWTGRDHTISFANFDEAKAEYARLKGLYEAQLARRNDSPDTVEVVGAGMTLTFALKDMRGVRLVDFFTYNANLKSSKEEFSDMWRKSE
jgi:hypothetical protein